MNLNKMFVFIFVFMLLFGALLGTMPGEFKQLGIEANVQDKEVRDYFNAHDVIMYNQTLPINITYGVHEKEDFGLPPPQQIMFWFDHWALSTGIRIVHLTDCFWGWWWGQHDLHVQEPEASKVGDPSVVRKDELLALFVEDYNASYMEWACDHINIKLFIMTYNQSWTLSESWDNGKLKLYTSFEIDWTATGTSMWGVMGQILAFQNPELGVPGVGGQILTIGVGGALWACIAILFFALITSVIPTISGWRGQ